MSLENQWKNPDFPKFGWLYAGEKRNFIVHITRDSGHIYDDSDYSCNVYLNKRRTISGKWYNSIIDAKLAMFDAIFG